MTSRLERRYFPVTELRATSENGMPCIYGHAAVFNSNSEDLGGFIERIAPKAFMNAIPRDDVRGLFNHDPNYILGRNRAGTLSLKEDDRGLAYQIKPDPEISYVNDVMRAIERGDVTSNSFSFRTDAEKWDWSATPLPVRTLYDVGLFDIGPVTFPAYQAADAHVRSFRDILSAAQEAQARDEPEEDEETSSEPDPKQARRIWAMKQAPLLIHGRKAL